ncbi:hypothetical protein AB8880_02490 [Alphaproteobacteria bacterium LSUCC0684]
MPGFYQYRSFILGALLIVAAGIGAFMIKSHAIEKEQELAEILAQIEAEKDRITVLEADWSYLTRPARIQHLSREMLSFEPVTPDRILSLDIFDKAKGTTPPEGLFRNTIFEGVE